ncbi:MAG: DUF4359 domain-containing protein [Cyanobacteriota bacterium]|nr:DUF4359 domain-containing protein [Cyanobacteriota bacterium]
MKASQIAIALGGITLVGLAAGMAITNPSSSDYESFATEHLTQYLKDNACQKLPSELGGVGQQWCQALGNTVVDTGRPQLQQLIANQTQRSNFILFSVYRTRLALGPFPPYEFETLGILQQFYTYRTEESI